LQAQHSQSTRSQALFARANGFTACHCNADATCELPPSAASAASAISVASIAYRQNASPTNQQLDRQIDESSVQRHVQRNKKNIAGCTYNWMC